jgi:dihydroorotate dehydrogenase (NAD+) catalytic subunit
MIDLSSRVAGISLNNPLMLASGILDENGYTMRRILEEGASAVVTKSIGLKERSGYSTPVVVDLGHGDLLNAVGLSNPGIDRYGEEIAIALKAKKPIIGSIFGSTPEEFSSLARKMQEFGVSGIELNLSCPHVKGEGLEIGSDPEMVESIVEAVKGSVNVPVFSKLSANTSNIMETVNAASKSDGFVLINTIRAMAIDIYARKPVLSNGYGGLSGRSIKSVGVRYVYEVKKETGAQIIGVGGISTAEDVIEYMMAGASAVQIGTAVGFYGRSIFKKIDSDLIQLVEKIGFSRISDLVGAAL